MSDSARWILTIELASIIAMAVISLVIHLVGRKPRGQVAALTWWQLTGVFVVAAIEAATLLLVLHNVQWPEWFLEVVYGLVNSVMAGWLFLRWWTKLGRTTSVGPSEVTASEQP